MQSDSLYKKRCHNFKILQMNTGSINKILDNFFMLQNLKSHIAFIILTKTKEVIDESIFSINGYNIIYNESRVRMIDIGISNKISTLLTK